MQVFERQIKHDMSVIKGIQLERTFAIGWIRCYIERGNGKGVLVVAENLPKNKNRTKSKINYAHKKKNGGGETRGGKVGTFDIR